MSRPSRQFSGVIGEASADNAGPVVLAADLDKLFKMFNPDISGGGISRENLNFTISEVASLATPYSTTSTYTVGSFCTYNGYLYRCNTAITTAEAWTAAHWTSVVAMNVLKAHLDNTSNPHSVTATQVPNTHIDGVEGTNVQATLKGLKDVADTKATTAALTSHTSATSNPHSVTKAQIGLGNCDNTSDANKPISTATQSALDLKQTIANSNSHINDVSMDATTYVLTFKRQSGNDITIDLPIETMPDHLEFREDTTTTPSKWYLCVIDKTGVTRSKVEVTSLYNELAVDSSSTTITLTITSDASTGGKRKLSAEVKDNSITFTKLATAVQTRITTLETNSITGVTDTDTIDLGIEDHKITAFVKDGSITSGKLASGLYTEIQGFATRAETAADNAEASESNASTYATNAGNSASAASNSASAASGSATAASNSASSASDSATAASGSATTSSNKALVSEGWAVGKQNGVDVTSESPYYQNNAKWYKEQAEQASTGDMLKSVYDPTLTVLGAGGIPSYVEARIPFRITILYNSSQGYYVVSKTIEQIRNALINGMFVYLVYDGNREFFLDTVSETESSIEFNFVSIDGSNKAIRRILLSGSSGTPSVGEYTEYYQPKLTFDTTPTTNSTNPVTSGGIKTYVDGKATWGAITGTLANQSDLNTALSGKVDLDSSSTESFTLGYDSNGLYVVTD